MITTREKLYNELSVNSFVEPWNRFLLEAHLTIHHNDKIGTQRLFRSLN